MFTCSLPWEHKCTYVSWLMLQTWSISCHVGCLRDSGIGKAIHWPGLFVGV